MSLGDLWYLLALTSDPKQKKTIAGANKKGNYSVKWKVVEWDKMSPTCPLIKGTSNCQ